MPYEGLEERMDRLETVLNSFIRHSDLVTRHSIYVLGMGPETMEILNLAELRPPTSA